MQTVLTAFAATLVMVAGGVSAAAATTSQDVMSTMRVTMTASDGVPNAFADQAEYDPTNSTGGGYAGTDRIQISIAGGTAHRTFGLSLQPPTGATFGVGTYLSDSGGTIDSGSDSCQGVQFTIVDLATNGAAITRLDLDFQTSCNESGDVPTALIFGEVQLGEPDNPSILTGTRTIQWPTTAVRTTAAATVPVWVRNTATTAQRVGTPTLYGDTSSFGLAADSCVQRTLAPRAACLLTVRFTPDASGRLETELEVPVGGTSVSTTLRGLAPTGRTALSFTGNSTDRLGLGQSYLFTDAETSMQVATAAADTFYAVVPAHDEDWTVIFRSYAGSLHPGYYSIADQGPFHFTLTGEGRGCADTSGSGVRVHQAVFDPLGHPIRFDATFRQECDGGRDGTVRGEIAYRSTVAPEPFTAAFVVRPGQHIAVGSSVTNDVPGAASFRLTVTAAGRAVLTGPNSSTVRWATPAVASRAGDHLGVTRAGELVLVAPDGAHLWHSPSSSAVPGSVAVLQSDGRLVLDSGDDVPEWSVGG